MPDSTVEVLLERAFDGVALHDVCSETRELGIQRLLGWLHAAGSEEEKLLVWLACLRVGCAPPAESTFSDPRALARAVAMEAARRHSGR